MKTITIVGGGLAGLSLGLSLRRAGVPVVIFEAGSYPCHRVCGEFLSGRGLRVLEQLGLQERLRATGAVPARTLRWFAAGKPSPLMPLPGPCLNLSRYRLDAILAEAFQEQGGQLMCGTRADRASTAEGWVWAAGRRPAAVVNGWRYWGLKVHARGLRLEADLEMHWTADAYVGLARIENGRVNLCGLFRTRQAVPDLRRHWRHWLSRCLDAGARERLAHAALDETSFAAVAALGYGLPASPCDRACCLGDAYRLIPPFTGNGMSQALESAECALHPLVAYAAGREDWSHTCRRIRARLGRRFQTRHRYAEVLHRALWFPWPEALKRLWMRALPGLMPLFYRTTR